MLPDPEPVAGVIGDEAEQNTRCVSAVDDEKVCGKRFSSKYAQPLYKKRTGYYCMKSQQSHRQRRMRAVIKREPVIEKEVRNNAELGSQ